MVIKGFENEDIEVSEFGEWVGNDYIDYKADYKEHKKIISALFTQRQELIDNWNKLEEFIDNAIYNSWYLYNLNTVCQYEDGIRAKTYESVSEKMKEILSKIEKE